MSLQELLIHTHTNINHSMSEKHYFMKFCIKSCLKQAYTTGQVEITVKTLLWSSEAYMNKVTLGDLVVSY